MEEKKNIMQPSLTKGKLSLPCCLYAFQTFPPPSLEKHFAKKISISNAFFRREKSNISFTVPQTTSVVTITSQNIWNHSEEILSHFCCYL